MMQDDKKMAWIIAFAIIAAAIIVAVALNENAMNTAGGPEHNAAGTANNGAVGGAAGGTASGSLSGQEVRTKYADRTIQFDEACEATPVAPTYKNGTTVLLDNRFEAARAISIGGHQYTVPGYGYVLVNLFSSTLPQKYNVDCDFRQNVSTILLQK